MWIVAVVVVGLDLECVICFFKIFAVETSQNRQTVELFADGCVFVEASTVAVFQLLPDLFVGSFCDLVFETILSEFESWTFEIALELESQHFVVQFSPVVSSFEGFFEVVVLCSVTCEVWNFNRFQASVVWLRFFGFGSCHFVEHFDERFHQLIWQACLSLILILFFFVCTEVGIHSITSLFWFRFESFFCGKNQVRNSCCLRSDVSSDFCDVRFEKCRISVEFLVFFIRYRNSCIVELSCDVPQGFSWPWCFRFQFNPRSFISSVHDSDDGFGHFCDWRVDVCSVFFQSVDAMNVTNDCSFIWSWILVQLERFFNINVYLLLSWIGVEELLQWIHHDWNPQWFWISQWWHLDLSWRWFLFRHVDGCRS